MEEFDKLRVFFNLIGIKTEFNITLDGNRQIIAYYDQKRIFDVTEIVKHDKTILELYLPATYTVYLSYLAKNVVRYLLEHVKAH